MVLAWIFKEKWFWIIILACVTVILVPFIIVSIMLSLPPIYKIIGTVLLVVFWGAAGAYKDWTKEKREAEKKVEPSGSA